MKPKFYNHKTVDPTIRKTLPTKKSHNARSSKFDSRPIRDQLWISNCKSSLIELLELSDYSTDIDENKLNKLSALDIRMMFDHIMRLTSPNFQLNNSELSWGDRILKIFQNLEYPGAVTKTHLANPAIRSSVPIVLAAFDYIRRFVTVFYKMKPIYVMPRVEDWEENICSIVTNSIIEFNPTTARDENQTADVAAANAQEDRKKFAYIMTRNFGILTEEQIEQKRKEMKEMDDLVSELERLRGCHDEICVENKVMDQEIEKENQSGKYIEDQTKECLALCNIEKRDVDELERKQNILSEKYKSLRDDGTLALVKTIEDIVGRTEELHLNKQRETKEIDNLEDQWTNIEKAVSTFRLEILREITEFSKSKETVHKNLFACIMYNFTIENMLSVNSPLKNKLEEFENSLLKRSESLKNQVREFDRKEKDCTTKIQQLELQMQNKSYEYLELQSQLAKVSEAQLNNEDRKGELGRKIKTIHKSINESIVAKDTAEKLVEQQFMQACALKQERTEAAKFYDINLNFTKKLSLIEIDCLQSEVVLTEDMNEFALDILENAQKQFIDYNTTLKDRLKEMSAAID